MGKSLCHLARKVHAQGGREGEEAHPPYPKSAHLQGFFDKCPQIATLCFKGIKPCKRGVYISNSARMQGKSFP